MNAKNLIPLLVLCLAVRCPALDEEGTRIGDELVTTLQEEMKELAGADGDNNEAAAVRNYIRQVQAALTQENSRSAEQLLSNLGNYDPTAEVRKRIDALRKALKDELRANTDAVISELKVILEVAREKVSRAAEPEELDKILESLSQNRFTNGRNSEGYDSNDATIRGLLSEMSSARQFVTSWQDYLQASNGGNVAQATQSLQNLASQEITLIPRSQIIARLEFEKASGAEAAKITGRIASLGDMKAAIEKLSAMAGNSRSSSSDNAQLRATLQNLARLEKTYREFLAGLPVNVEVLYQSSDSSDMVANLDFIQLRADLLLLVFPRYLDLPDEFQAMKGETVDHFLKRAIDDATARTDTAACRRIKDIGMLLVKSGTFRQNDLDALHDYAAGQSQLAAGQHLLAVVSLQKALAAGNELIPAVKAGEMLQAIKDKHPEEYEKGMMEFLTPRPTPEFDYSRMPYRGYRPSYPGSRDERGTTVVLPVPSKDVEPAETEPDNGTSPSSPATLRRPGKE